MKSCVLALLVLAASVVCAGEDVDAAREHYKNGTKAYDLGRYIEAAHEYEAAYQAKDDPALLFNIAQAYRLAGDNVNAIHAYRSYLRRTPDAENRAQVELRIGELQRAVEQQERARHGPPEGTIAPSQTTSARPATTRETSAVVERRAPPERPPLYKKWWLWTAVGAVAVVGLGVGLGVGLTRSSPSPSFPLVTF